MGIQSTSKEVLLNKPRKNLKHIAGIEEYGLFGDLVIQIENAVSDVDGEPGKAF